MSQHPLHAPHARRGRFAFAIRRTFATALGLAALVGVTSAAEPAPPASAAPGLADVVLARSALAALDAEPELRRVNLVVSVVDGVAVVGGSVPSAAVSKRAEQVLRKVEGVKDVRNTCFVSAGPDPLLKAVADKGASALPPRPVMAELPGVITNQMPPPASLFPPNTTLATNDPAGGAKVVALRPPTAVGVLGAPVGPVGSGTAPAAAPQAVPATAPGVLTGTPPAPAADVLVAAGEARKTEPRFAKLTVELRDGTLVVGGSAPLASDAWDYAEKLRKIPGVSRVAVGSVVGK
jgi:hypothetical protein